MDDSAEEMFTTDLRFEQGGVSQKFNVNEKRRKEEIFVPGKLFITENRFGQFLEWKPEPIKQGDETSAGTRELPVVHGSVVHGGIGFRAGQDESVSFIPDPNSRSSEHRRPIRIELSEIRSLMLSPKSGQRELIFILCDGTITNPFIFERGSPENLMSEMERSVVIKKSRHNKGHFVVSPKKDSSKEGMKPASAQLQTVAELFPEQYNQITHIWGFVKELKSDPYAATCTVLAKVADMTLNGGDASRSSSGDHSPINGHHSGQTEPLLNTPRRDEFNTSLSSEGLDADYTTNEEGYEVIFKPEKPSIELGPRPKTFRGQPLSQEQWLNYLDNEGRLPNFEEIQQIVFRGGVEPLIRTHVWPILLGLYDPTSTYEERRHQLTEKTCIYNRIKMQWATISEDQEERFHAFRDFKSLVEKDVARTDRTLDFFKEENSRWSEILKNILMTYIMYNFNLGYVQGMSDILSPILMEVQDEIMAFWIFAKFMERIHTNFEMSQEGMQQQLKDSYTLMQVLDPMFSAYLDACDASNMYFEFRWLLILFKREFSTTDTLTLWESLWTQLPGANFQLFVGLAILVQHRSTVMENKFGLSEILRHVNDLAMRIDLEKTLTIAEGMYLQITQAQDKLPNSIRTIINLPPLDEPVASTSMAMDTTLEIIRDPNTSEPANPGGSYEGADADERYLESQFEMSISQFT